MVHGGKRRSGYYGSSEDTVEEGTNWRRLILAAILILLSGIYRYDSAAIDGSLPIIQNHFTIGDSQTALINTFSSLAHSLSLAALWMMGDLISRKILVTSSLIGWIVCSFLSLATNSSSYWVFVTLRSCSSIFGSVFGVLIPVVLADLFDDKSLGKALMFLAFTEMISGIVSSSITSWFVTASLPWFSPLLIPPIVSLLFFPSIICLMKTKKKSNIFKKYSFRDSLKLFSIKSFLLMVIGQSMGMFNLTASSFWSPSFLLAAWTFAPSVFMGLSYPLVITLNSFISLFGTIIGLPLVVWIAHSWNFGTGLLRNHRNEGSFPIVVSIGSLASVVSYLIVLLSTGRNFLISSISLFLTGFCSAAEASLSQLMLLAVVPRRSRSSAVSLSRLISGIVSIPAAQFVGQLSDILAVDSETVDDRFLSFRNALLASWVFVLLCALSYTFVVFFYAQDAKNAREKDAMEKEEKEEADSLLRSIEARNSRMLRSAIHTPSLFLFSFGQEIILRQNMSVAAPLIHGCYFTNWAVYRPEPAKFTPEKIPVGLCTHIFYAFAAVNIATYEAKLTDSWSDIDLKSMSGIQGLKKKQPGLKTLLSFGGWTESATGIYAKVAGDPAKRTKFVRSAWALANSNGFDGIDLDWEYPDGANKANFVALIKELKSQSGGKLVTAAVSAGTPTINAGYDVPSFEKYVDYLTVMSYDFHFGSEPKIAHQGSYSETIAAMNTWNQKGMPKNKLLMGIGAYGRGWNAQTCALGAAGNGAMAAQTITQEGGYAAYFEIAKMGGRTIQTTEGAFLEATVNGQKVCIGYDDRTSILKKTDFIKKNGFAGAFTWTIDFDGPGFPVHNAIKDGLSGGSLAPLPLPSRTTRAPLPVPVPSVTTKKTNPAPVPAPSGGKCTDGTMRANVNKSKYDQCLWGSWQTRDCPPGTVFDPLTNNFKRA